MKVSVSQPCGHASADSRRTAGCVGSAIISGTGLAFARAIGEYGSVVLIGGNIPRETQVASQYIQQQIEIDRPVNAAAVSVALLAIAFVTLAALRWYAGRGLRREEDSA